MPRLASLSGRNFSPAKGRGRGPDLGSVTTRNTLNRSNAYFVDSPGDGTQNPFSFYGQGGTFWPVWYAHKTLYIYEVRFNGITQASGNFRIRFGFYSTTINGLRNDISTVDSGSTTIVGSQGNFYPNNYEAGGVNITGNTFTGEGWGPIPAGNYFSIPCWDHKYFRSYPNPDLENATTVDADGNLDVTRIGETWFYDGFQLYGRQQDPVDFSYLLSGGSTSPAGDWPEALGGDYSTAGTPEFQKDYFYSSFDPSNPQGQAHTPYATLYYYVQGETIP